MGWTASDIPSQSGRTAVVTGASGLGYETALALARAGAAVILAGRNPDKGAASVARIMEAAPNANVRFEALDLADLRSIANFAERLRGCAIHILINNAGLMSPPKRRTTADGFEAQFGTNYLGHFALTARLLPLLRKSTASRVVSVTSLAHHNSKINFDDLHFEAHYFPTGAYSQSKLAQAMFAIELQRRSDAAGWGLISNAAHPGYAGTDLFQNERGARSLMNIISMNVVIPMIGQSAADGALPTLYAAASPRAVGGALYGPTGFLDMRGPPGARAFAPAAHDAETARRLWEVSERLAGVRVATENANA